MRRRRTLVVLIAAAAALAAPTASHATRPRAGGWVFINPALKRTAVDFTSWASSSGGVLGSYVAHFTVTGTIAGAGYVTAVDDQWTQAVMEPGTTRPEHHVYPAAALSNVVLVYTGSLVAADTGVPTAYCQSVLTRVNGRKAVTVGTC